MRLYPKSHPVPSLSGQPPVEIQSLWSLMRDQRYKVPRCTPQNTPSDYDYLIDCMASCRLTPLYSTIHVCDTPGWYSCLQDSSQQSLSQGQRSSRFIKVISTLATWALWHLESTSAPNVSGQLQRYHSGFGCCPYSFLSEKARHIQHGC